MNKYLINLSKSYLLLAYLCALPTILSYYYGFIIDFNKVLLSFFSIGLLMIPIILFPSKSRVYLIIISIPLFLSMMSSVLYMYVFGAEMLQGAFYDIMESNVSEAGEFAEMYANTDFIFIIIGLLIVPSILLRGIKKNEYHLNYLYRFGLIILFCVFSFTNDNYKNIPTIYHVNSVLQYQDEFEEFKQMRIKRVANREGFKNIENTNPYDGEETYVLIIGESTSRVHMSLYDYHRKTNPLLEKKKDDLYVFKDVLSPHCHTLPTLDKALNFANFENMDLLYDKGSFIDYFNEAGYKTMWISNQRFIGKWECSTSIVAYASDKINFVNEKDAIHEVSYDERLFLPFEKALKDKAKKKLIVLHLLGTHGIFDKRYPDSYKQFNEIDDIPHKEYLDDKKKAMINTYDNAVLYNDYIISEIIDRVEAQNKNSYVLYFSDHGDDIYDAQDFVGHSWDKASGPMFEIPFILWLSDKYKAHNKDKVEVIAKSEDNKYQTDDFIHTIIDLSNLTSDELEEDRSIINKNFLFRERKIENIEYDRKDTIS